MKAPREVDPFIPLRRFWLNYLRCGENWHVMYDFVEKKRKTEKGLAILETISHHM